MPLFANDTVQSFNGGTAKVRFLDGNFVLLGPGDSMLVIFARTNGVGRGAPPNVLIDKGAVGRGLRALGGWTEN